MKFQEFKYLLKKFKTDQCTLSDLRKLDQQLKDKKLVKNWLSRELDESPNDGVRIDFEYEELFKKIKHKIYKQPRAKSTQKIIPFKTIIQVAAVLISVFLFGGLVSFLIFRQTHETKKTNQFCEVVAPYGARSEVVLPDGSKVWLNAGSKLCYSTDFNISSRRLALTGEGFFDVSKNKKLPFVVDALSIEITALGTQFNVKAYKEDETIETTLIEGKVMLNSKLEDLKFSENIYLLPNQKAVLIKERKELAVENIAHNKKEAEKTVPAKLIVKKKIDLLPEVSWINNRLVFYEKELSKILIELERKYNVRFNFELDQIKNYKFTGTLEDETLQQVLDVIKLSAPFDYKIKGNEVTLAVNTERIRTYEKQLKTTKNN